MKPDSTDVRFRMPAEWEKHRATWLAWPHNLDTWPNNLHEAQSEFVQLVRAIAAGETVCIVASGEALTQAIDQLCGIQNVEYFDVPTNDAWIRDHGPTFVIDQLKQTTTAIDWVYNGWGEKYPPFDQDQLVARQIAEEMNMPAMQSELIIEGGALEVNGLGMLITTESCLLNPNRNGDKRSECEEALRSLCGAKDIVWLPGADLNGDDTDGHVDQQVRFVNAQTLVVARDPNDTTQSYSLEQNRTALQQALQASENQTTLVDIDIPGPLQADRTIPASYMNFYLCNAGLILPQFGDPHADEQAAEILASLISDRPLIRLPSGNLAFGLGSFHCLTQQEPAVSPR